MEYKDLEKVNSELKGIDVKGKEYIEVNKRILAFRKLYPEGTIETLLVSNDNGTAVIKATVKNIDLVLATGYAYEREGSTFINKTSYIENCETSAVGRALGMLGIGIDTSIASAEEVENAMLQQEMDKQVTDQEAEILYNVMIKKGLDDDKITETLQKNYKVNTINELTKAQYGAILNKLNK